MNVLTLTPFYPTRSDDASGCFVAEPILAMSKLDVVSTVIAAEPFYSGIGSPAGTTPARWVRYPAVPGGFGLSSSGMLLFARILSYVRELHAAQTLDLIHAHAPLPCGHAAALLSRELGIPFVVTVHGLDAFSTNQVSGLPGRWCKRVSRMVFRAAGRVICISEKVRQAVLEGSADSVSTAVVYNGADPVLFSPAQNVSTSRSILSVGNLIPIKGHESVLRAFASIHKEFPDVSWEIIGDGPERQRLEGLASSLGVANRVHFLGRRSRREVADAMRRCTLFVLPSRYEGLGCVYLETMAAGKPAVACLGQGIGEIIRSGINGCLVSPGDETALAGTLSTLLGNAELRERIGRAGRDTVLSSFTLSHQAEHLVRIYRECVT